MLRRSDGADSAANQVHDPPYPLADFRDCTLGVRNLQEVIIS